MKKIGVIVGSLRKESFNRKVAKNVLGMFPEGYEAEIIEIGELVHYNEDLDQEGRFRKLGKILEKKSRH